MDKQKALNFLRDHQPMPSDDFLSENIDLLNIYDEIREFFEENPDPECVPLLINSFGCIDGLGVYQLVVNTISKYPADIVLPTLKQSLESSIESIVYWSTQIAAHFPDLSLERVLLKLSRHTNVDIRYSSISALSFIESDNLKVGLTKLLEFEKDKDIIELIHEVINN